MPLIDIRARAIAGKGKFRTSGRIKVQYRNAVGKIRNALVLGEGTGIGAPTTLAAAAIGAGGTFAAGTYFWKVTATNSAGESIGSNEASAVLILNGSANLTWTLPTGATGIKVYRGTASNTQNILVATLGAVSATTDANVGGAGAVPGTDTTGIGVRLAISSEDGRIVNNVPLATTTKTNNAYYLR